MSHTVDSYILAAIERDQERVSAKRFPAYNALAACTLIYKDNRPPHHGKHVDIIDHDGRQRELQLEQLDRLKEKYNGED